MKKDGLRSWPPDLQLTDEMKAFAYMKGIDPLAEYEAWEDDCKAHGRKYIDWVAAWRTRVRNAVKFNPTHRAVTDNDGGLARRPLGEAVNGKSGRLDSDSGSGVPDVEFTDLTLEQRRANIARFKEMVASIGKKVS